MTDSTSGENLKNSNYLCDSCEKKVVYNQIHQTETSLLLCPDCFHYLGTVPGGIKESVERFLLGNVI